MSKLIHLTQSVHCCTLRNKSNLMRDLFRVKRLGADGAAGWAGSTRDPTPTQGVRGSHKKSRLRCLCRDATREIARLVAIIPATAAAAAVSSS